MEEKIYERQVTKISTSHRVLDEKQIARHYTAHELAELYEFQPDKVYVNPNILYKDNLLARIVNKHSEHVGGYHEHDSLLQHKFDEEMLESEKDSAWTGFSEDTASKFEFKEAKGCKCEGLIFLSTKTALKPLGFLPIHLEQFQEKKLFIFQKKLWRVQQLSVKC